MAFADIANFSTAALLSVAVTAAGIALFWATAALQRWLDAEQNDASASIAAGPSAAAPSDELLSSFSESQNPKVLPSAAATR